MTTESPCVVLLHPFPMDASFWGPVWRELDIEATLLTPEFPGFGETPVLEGASIEAFAQDVARQIDATDRSSTVVVGLSLGGYVALALAAGHPQLADGYVLANTRAEPDDAAARTAREHGIDTIRIDGLDTFLDSMLPRLLSPDADPQTWERATAIAERQDPDAVCAALEALRNRPDRSDVLGTIDVPTRIVAGADDAVTPRESIDALVAGIPGATLTVIERCGHLSALEHPAEFAAVVRSLLTEIGSPGH